MNIPFHISTKTGLEGQYLAEVVKSGFVKGDGIFTKQCEELLQAMCGKESTVLLTSSCTAALEMAAILIDIQPGDEVILPSFTFSSTANAFLLRGATLKFVDIRPDTLNLDEEAVKAAISSRTRAICPVHYGGVSCDMEMLLHDAALAGIKVIEDAAQGVLGDYKNRQLGSLGDLGAFSFHESKNYSCGEGGALIINDPSLVDRAHWIREKGTNRQQFAKGEVDKYTWVDVGSSYLASELNAAYLYPQLLQSRQIKRKRMALWERYYRELQPLSEAGCIRLPYIPEDVNHSAHLFYILLESEEKRTCLIEALKEQQIAAVFHYIPLHLAPMGRSLGYSEGSLRVTESIYSKLLRLPFYTEMTEEQQSRVIQVLYVFFDCEYRLQEVPSLAGCAQ
jgi:dTDP-4-amino-4,6-dideoxygalactose transaminase